MVLQTNGMPPTTQHSVLGENFRLIGQILGLIDLILDLIGQIKLIMIKFKKLVFFCNKNLEKFK